MGKIKFKPIILIFTIFSLISTLSPTNSNLCAQGIIIVKSQDIEPYNMAIKGINNIILESSKEYVLEEKFEDNKILLKKIKKNKPDLIIAVGLLATKVISEEIKDIPIIYSMVLYPQRYDFINKGNISGIKLDIPVKTQLGKFKEAFPSIKRIGVIYNKQNNEKLITKANAVSKKLDISLTSIEINNQKEVPAALREIINKIDALWLIPDNIVLTKESFEFLLFTSLENNIPVLTFSEQFVKAGALMAIVPDYVSIGEQVGTMANEVFRKEKDIIKPEKEPEKIKIYINKNIADKLAINVLPDVLTGAYEVIN